jgi:hypothetical protein
MGEYFDAEAETEPFKKIPCKGCKATQYAHAKLSAIDLKPDSCDRCPAEKKDTTPATASQEVL